MQKNLVKTIAKCLIDTLIAIEQADENLMNEDLAVNILEQISADLKALSADDKVTLVNEISALSEQYPKELSKYVNNIPRNFGIIDTSLAVIHSDTN